MGTFASIKLELKCPPGQGHLLGVSLVPVGPGIEQRGHEGTHGDTGDTGDTGDSGDSGDSEDTGDTRDTGDNGDTGTAGTPGTAVSFAAGVRCDCLGCEQL